MLRIVETLGRAAASGVSGKSIARRTACLSPAYVDFLVCSVENIEPGAALRPSWFRKLGVSERGVSAIVEACRMFNARAFQGSIHSELGRLAPADHEIASTFFHLLQRHYARRDVPLDLVTAERQLRAVRRNLGLSDPSVPVPAHCLQAVLCSLLGCNEVKNYIVQVDGTGKYGCHRLTWDDVRRIVVCTSKRSIAYKPRNTERLFSGAMDVERDDPTLGLILPGRDPPEPVEPEWARIARCGTREEFDAAFHVRDEDLDVILAGDAERQSGRAEARNCLRSVRDYVALLRSLDVTPSGAGILDVRKQDIAHLNGAERAQLRAAVCDVTDQATTEARVVFRSKYQRPCYQVPVTVRPLCGFVLENDSIKEHETTHPITICPGCGYVTYFSLAMWGPNG